MIQLAADKNVVILCLPSHTTQALQLLDQSLFKPLMQHYRQEIQNWMVTNKEKKITRDVVGIVIGRAQQREATVKNGASGFTSPETYPFNRNAIPDYFFQISDGPSPLQLQQSVYARHSRELSISLNNSVDESDVSLVQQRKNPALLDESIIVRQLHQW